MESYIISFDVGGTSIKAGVVDIKLELVDEAIETYPSEADQDTDAVIENIINIVKEQWKKIERLRGTVGGLGFGFPGPFDYQKGISYIRGINKYESIYGIDISSEIKKRLLADKSIKFSKGFKLLFENDAVVFALGEYLKGQGKDYERIMCLTLGTGCGSTFLNRGEIVRGEFDIPESGWIFNEALRDSTIDNWISRRGILRLAAKHGFDIEKNDVKDLDILARAGDIEALEVFHEFGALLGEVLKEYILKFRPECIVLGGRISRAYDLFNTTMDKEISGFNIPVRISRDLSKSALIGAAGMFGITG